ncbi:hypothetical protein FXO37_15660 [Capsicum annuum]|nr:hypothetical protein FXO37_15660 [Capsicum annuum]
MDSEELLEQSQTGKSEAGESSKNGVEGGGEGYIEAGEENKSEEEEEEDKQDEKDVESEKDDDHHHNDNASPMGCELRSKFLYGPIKTISIKRFQVVMLIDDPAELTSDFVLKSQLGKPFDDVKNTTKKEKLDEFFKKSYFRRFLNLLRTTMPISKQPWYIVFPSAGSSTWGVIKI